MVEIVKQIVIEEDNGIRLDRWFQRHYKQYSFAAVSKLARTGQVRVNGKRVKSADRIVTNQEIRFPNLIHEDSIRVTNHTPVDPRKQYSELIDHVISNIAYMDPHVIIINKPVGLAVQGGNGISISVDHIADELKFEARDRPRLVHRIDKETSGLLVLARTIQAAQDLSTTFQEQKVEKKYLAITQGVPNPLKGTINAPLEKKEHGAGFENMSVSANGKESITKYKVLGQNKGIALVEFEPITGRKHQIRAHAAHIGCPLLKDRKYNQKMSEYAKLNSELCLHASSISFTVFGEQVTATATLPQSFIDILKFFDIQQK